MKNMALFVFFFVHIAVYSNNSNLIPYRIGNLWGYSDYSGKIIIKPQYQSASVFRNDIAIVRQKGWDYLINTENKKVTKAYTEIYYNNLCGIACYDAVYKGQTIYLNYNGEVIENSACCQSNYGMSGDPNTKIPFLKDTSILNTKYQYFSNDTSKTFIKGRIFPISYHENFKNYYIALDLETRLYGIVYHTGNSLRIVFESQYQSIAYMIKNDERYFIVKKDNLSALLTEQRTIINFKYQSISYEVNYPDILWVRLQNGKTGYINFDGYEYFKD